MAQDTSSAIVNVLPTVPAEQLDESFFQIGVFSLGGILGSIVTFILTVIFKGNIDNKIEKKSNEIEKSFNAKSQALEDVFKQTVNDNKARIENWINTHKTEDRLINTYKIALCGETDNDEAEKLLCKVGFLEKNILKHGETEYDILFINNQEGSLDEETLLKLVENMNNDAVAFYYSNKLGLHYPIQKLYPKEKRILVNFANSSAQVYGNLLNSMKFRERLMAHKG